MALGLANDKMSAILMVRTHLYVPFHPSRIFLSCVTSTVLIFYKNSSFMSYIILYWISLFCNLQSISITHPIHVDKLIIQNAFSSSIILSF